MRISKLALAIAILVCLWGAELTLGTAYANPVPGSPIAPPIAAPKPTDPPVTSPAGPVEPLAPVQPPIAPGCVECAPGNYSGANCGGCPAGYCMGANNCRRCDVGHEAPKKGMENCTRCAPGRFGPSVGLAACEPCPIGSYCPQHENGTVTPTLCPIGFHCPVRSLPFPVSCNPGYYCPERGMNTPRLCPAGFSCPQSRTFNPTPCPENYFCSGGTISPERCPTLYRSRTKAAKCSAAPAFFAIIVIAVIVVFCVAFGIYFFRDKWMPGPDPENHISTKRAQSPGERSRLMMAQDEDDIAYHGT